MQKYLHKCNPSIAAFHIYRQTLWCDSLFCHHLSNGQLVLVDTETQTPEGPIWLHHSIKTRLSSLPALNLHAKLWRPSALSLAPHLHSCGLHKGATILRSTATVEVSTSSCVPNEGTGIDPSHIPDSDSVGASNLALSTLLDSSKSVSNLALQMHSSQFLCFRLDYAVECSVLPLGSSHNVPTSISQLSGGYLSAYPSG